LQARIFGAAQTDTPPSDAPPKPQRDSSTRSLVRTAIRLLLEQPALGRELHAPTGLEDLDLPGVPLLLELLELARHNPQLTTGAVLEHWRGRPEQQHLARLAATPLAITEAGYEPEFRGAVQRLIEQRNSRRVEDLLMKERRSGLSKSEKDELRQLFTGTRTNNGPNA
jgi:DNA primase